MSNASTFHTEFTLASKHVERVDPSIISVASGSTVRSKHINNDYPKLGSRSNKEPEKRFANVETPARDPTNPWKIVKSEPDEQSENPWAQRNKSKPRPPSSESFSFSSAVAGGKLHFLNYFNCFFYFKIMKINFLIGRGRGQLLNNDHDSQSLKSDAFSRGRGKLI